MRLANAKIIHVSWNDKTNFVTLQINQEFAVSYKNSSNKSKNLT